MWIDGRYKLIVGRVPAPGARPNVALYDIYADPGEEDDIAPLRPQTVEAMRSKLDAWRQSLRASHLGNDF